MSQVPPGAFSPQLKKQEIKTVISPLRNGNIRVKIVDGVIESVEYIDPQVAQTICMFQNMDKSTLESTAKEFEDLFKFLLDLME